MKYNNIIKLKDRITPHDNDSRMNISGVQRKVTMIYVLVGAWVACWTCAGVRVVCVVCCVFCLCCVYVCCVGVLCRVLYIVLVVLCE